ncbi:MAG: MBL fold metallo-hydrolase [Candidatus Bathyarchaeia archaeon]
MGSSSEIQKDMFYMDTYAHNMGGAIGVMVYRDSGGSVIFDSGMPNSSNKILESIKMLGVKPRSVKYILLTHRHIDHAGGASFLLDEFPNASVGTHPFSIGALKDPSKIYEGGRELFGDYATPMKPVQTSRMIVLRDGEEIQVGGETIRAIYTPGHTSDHIAYYMCESKVLYCGDIVGSLNTMKMSVHPTCIYPSFDYEKYKATMKVMKVMKIEGLVFAHFGFILGRGNVEDVLDRSLSAHAKLERLYEENVSSMDSVRLIGELKAAMMEATEIFPGPVREKAAELMARGFIEGITRKGGG